ncbi:terminase small subunit [Devosia sp. 2618]|uniref:terminase small subunit n=1 Tax=Devosia sp. 2618 TaxID=3156454 RepID=UPI0033958922
MAVLKNAKHERFAQGLAKGMTADEAYVEAGYKPHRGNASTLRANQNILDRLAELQNRAAERAVVTVASITDRLLNIATKPEKSSDAPMLSVARAALMDAAKLNGLVVEKNLSAQTSVEDLLDQLDGKAG